jgi:hypothetical protein
MNKAFVREPEQAVDCCPRCGAQGQVVGPEVLTEYLTDALRQVLTEPASFCPTPRCAVAYFDGLERFVLASDLSRPVYPKDPTAPLCACFGLTRQDIERDVEEGVATRTRAVLEKAKSPGAQCARMAANGRSCVAHVQKYYLQCMNQRS